MGSTLRYFPFPLQAFPTRKGPDFCSDWCSEGNLPGSLQQLHGAAPAAPEPAGSGDRAQGTAHCSPSLLRLWKRFHFVVFLWPLATHSLLHVVLSCSWPPKASGGQAGAVVRAVLWLPSGLCPLHEAHSCLVSRVADGIVPWKCPHEEICVL